MLQIKQKFRLSLPQLNIFARPKPLQFSPVVDDDDELTQDIANETTERDDEWELEEHPDEVELEEYWSEVQSDIQSDPRWSKFSEGTSDS